MNNKYIKFYAVARGRIPGIYSSWGECQEQVHQYPDAKFKKFAKVEDAVQFIKDNTDFELNRDISKRFNNVPKFTKVQDKPEETDKNEDGEEFRGK